MSSFSATRSHGLERLAACVETLRRDDLQVDNADDAVRTGEFIESELGPYLRHRLLVEDEVAHALGAALGWKAALTVIGHLARRTYARGWALQHPLAVRRFHSDAVSLGPERLDDAALERALASASAGRTGIACFDGWVGEITQTGQLTGAGRRAFASIWIFTLKLPWQLGARFFLKQLLDAELATVLVEWREVAGLQPGAAPYLVTSQEIERLVGQRLARGSKVATALAHIEPEPTLPEEVVMPCAEGAAPGPILLIVTCDDLCPETWPVRREDVKGVLLVEPFDLYEYYGDGVHSFKLAGMADAMRRARAYFECPAVSLARDSINAAPNLARREDLVIRDWFDGIGSPRLTAIAPRAGGEDDLAAACQRVANGDRPPQLTLLHRPWDAMLAGPPIASEDGFRAQLPARLAALGIG
ncbi:MAG: hypothetical protein KKB37_03855 [Alphaproteobacteria bacterium]|nr:hypothetical protein [Alphaproteobacteria bacterium]